MKILERLTPYLFGAVGGALVLFQTAWPETYIPYPEVIVPARRIIEREPDTVRTFVDRIRFVTVPAVQVARAPGGAQAEVAVFCGPSVTAATASPSDTTETPAPHLLIRSGVHKAGWWLQRDAVLLTGPTSLGDLKAFDYQVRSGYSFRTSGDSLIIRYPRGAFLRDAAEVSIPILLGVGIGMLLGG